MTAPDKLANFLREEREAAKSCPDFSAFLESLVGQPEDVVAEALEGFAT